MSDKLTTVLKATDKKVEDISKSRLGNTYKNIIKMPDYILAPTQELVSMTDSVTTTKVNIVDPTHFYNEYLFDTLTEYATGTGTFTTNDLTKIMTENNGTLPCLEWYKIDVAAGQVNTYVTLRHTKGAHSSSFDYQDTVIKRVSVENVQYRNVVDMPRDITLVDSTHVDITFKPDVAGCYLLGLYNSTADKNVRLLDRIQLPRMVSQDTTRYMTFLGFTKPTVYDTNYDYSASSVFTSNRAINSQGYLYYTEQNAPGADVATDYSYKDIAVLGTDTGYSSARVDYFVMNNGDLFFPSYGRADDIYTQIRLLFSYNIGSPTGIKFQVVYTDGSLSSETTVSTIEHIVNAYKMTNPSPYTTMGSLGVIVKNVATADRDKVQSYVFRSNKNTGYFNIPALDTGKLKGKTFFCDRGGEVYMTMMDTSAGWDQTIYTYTAFGTITEDTDAYFTSVEYNVYKLVNASNAKLYIVSNRDVTISCAPANIVSTAGSFYSYRGYVADNTGSYSGKNFNFYFNAHGALKTINTTSLPMIKIIGGSVQAAHITVETSDLTSNYYNLAPGSIITVRTSGQITDSAVRIISDQPVQVLINSGDTGWTSGSTTYYGGGVTFMSRKYVVTPNHNVTPINVNTAIAKEIMDNYTVSTEGWQKDFDVSVYFDATALINWNDAAISGTPNISCFVSYSDNGSTFGPEYSVTKGSYFPSTGLTLSTRKIRVRFQVPSGNWLYNVQLAYYTWQAL